MPLSSKLSPFIALWWNEATPGRCTGHPYPASLAKWMWMSTMPASGLKESYTMILINYCHSDLRARFTDWYHTIPFCKTGTWETFTFGVWQRGLPETPTRLTCAHPQQDSELALLINIYQTSRSRVKVMGHPLIINGNKLTFEYQQEEGC